MSTIFAKTLKDVDLSDIKIPMAVIYDHPKDFPDVYLCRIWEGAGCHPTNKALQKSSPEKLREDILAAGFTARFPREEGDDKVILETWIK